MAEIDPRTFQSQVLTEEAGNASSQARAQSAQADLINQALDATLGHAQLKGNLTPQQLQEIVDFEMALTTAQAADLDAGGSG